MQARGNRDVSYEGTLPFAPGNSMPVKMRSMNFWQLLVDVFLKPYYNWPADRPSIYKIILVHVWTLLASFFFGWFYLGAGHYLFNGGIANAAFVTAIVAAGMAFATALLSYETDFRMITNPMLQFTRVLTRDIGVLPMLGLCAMSFGGFALAGWVGTAMGWTDPNLVDAPIANTSGGLWSWGAATVICLALMYIDHFEQMTIWRPYKTSMLRQYTAAGESGEYPYAKVMLELADEDRNHVRAFFVTYLFYFLSYLAFFTVGLRTYNPGLYLAAAISTGSFASGAWTLTTWAWFIFFMWFVPPLTAWLPYLLNVWLADLDAVYHDRIPTEDHMEGSQGAETGSDNMGQLPYNPESQQMRITSSRLRRRIPAK